LHRKGLVIGILILMLGVNASSSFESLFFTHDVGVEEIIQPFPYAPKNPWDLLFYFDANASSGGGGNYGAGFDDYFNSFYSTRYASNLIHKYDINGVLVEEFSISGVSNLRDLAYDGDYFYGGASDGNIWQMCFITQHLVNIVPSPDPISF